MLQAADRHLDTVLDRAAPERAAAVAGQGAHANGLPQTTLQFNVLDTSSPLVALPSLHLSSLQSCI